MIRLSRLLERRSDERGFTLIELAVAVGVFGILLVGLSFMFESAFSTSNKMRFDQRAKTLAQEKLEEIRALPFYVSQKTNTGDVDILDRYFPGTADGVTPTGAEGTYDGSTGVWTYTSTEQIIEDRHPPFTREVTIQFIVVDANGDVIPQPPISGYDSNDAETDRPATSAVLATVTVAWNDGSRDREVVLDTIITHIRQEEPKVEATGSVTAAQISGLEFFDGVPADILAQVASASVTFREVTGSTAHASADAVEVVERHPDTNSPLQPEGPKEGESTSSVPNSETGTVQTDSDPSMPAGTMESVNLPTEIIAEWGAVGPVPVPPAATEARVSARHTLNPEAKATVVAQSFGLNGRNEGALAPHRAIDVGSAVGQVEHESTTVEARMASSLSLADVVIWSAPQFTADPDYEGTVIIEGLTVETNAVAGTTSSSTAVEWTVTGLRIWDPELENPDDTIGGYVGPWTFGFISTCGGWVDDPDLCGPDRTDGLDPFENPNPVVIPGAYVGTDPDGNESLSLAIAAGATVREAEADASTGASNASVAQKNVLSITVRNDITDAQALEPMVVGLGDANASITYIAHEH